MDAEKRQHKIRLDGIDAPELGQPFGRASKQHLAALAANREAVAECGKTDRHGREVCRILVGGADAGLAQIRAGMAWYFKRYAKELTPDRRQQSAHAEAQAQAEQRGLWADAAPMPPWDWRATKKEGRNHERARLPDRGRSDDRMAVGGAGKGRERAIRDAGRHVLG